MFKFLCPKVSIIEEENKKSFLFFENLRLKIFRMFINRKKIFSANFLSILDFFHEF